MFQPARLKRARVASWRLPFGRPRRSLLATDGLRAYGIGKHDWLGEATDGTLVAYQSVAFDLHAEQQCVTVAVGCGGDYAQAIAACLALHPKLLAGAAPEGHEACLQSLGIAGCIEKAQHQNFPRLCVLHDARHKTVHLVEVNCCCLIAHYLPVPSWIAPECKKPADLVAGGLCWFLISLAVYFRPWQSAGMVVP